MVKQYRVNSVHKALKIVEFLGREAPRGYAMSEMEGRLSIKKSTLFVLLSTLLAEKVLAFDERERKYRLGMRLFEWGSAAAKGLDLKEMGSRYLEELTRRTRETSHLAVLDRGQVLFVEKMESPEPLKMSSNVGARFPLHAPATAKVLFCHQDGEKQKEMLSAMEFKPYTDRTIRSRQAYLREIEKVRDDGFAVDDEEIYKGTRCVAAPVFGATGKIACSIGITAPSQRFRRQDIRRVAGVVMSVAADFSKALSLSPLSD